MKSEKWSPKKKENINKGIETIVKETLMLKNKIAELEKNTIGIQQKSRSSRRKNREFE